MSDVIVTDSDDTGSADIAAIEIESAVATAENSAHAQHAAAAAVEGAETASQSAIIAEGAATTSIGASDVSVTAADSARDSALTAVASVAALQSEMSGIRALLEERLTIQDPTPPEPETKTPDTPPRKEHWLRRKVGK